MFQIEYQNKKNQNKPNLVKKEHECSRCSKCLTILLLRSLLLRPILHLQYLHPHLSFFSTSMFLVRSENIHEIFKDYYTSVVEYSIIILCR
jgi:hypothetical protein